MIDFSQATILHVKRPFYDQAYLKDQLSKFIFKAPRDGTILIDFQTDRPSEVPIEDVVFDVDVLNGNKEYILKDENPPVKLKVKANKSYYISIFRDSYLNFYIEINYE